MAKQVPGTTLTYLGQVVGCVPDRFLHPERGHKRFLVTDLSGPDVKNTYVYDAPRSTSRGDVESWSTTTFPYGCAIAVVQPTITRGRKS